jgi:hypothetical protein
VPARILIDLEALSRFDTAGVTARTARAPDDAPGRDSEPRFARAAANAVSPAVNRRALPTLGRLAREGRVALCSYVELRRTAASIAPSGPALALLGDVTLDEVEPAIDRDALDLDVFHDGTQPGALQRFCTLLKARHNAFSNLPPDVVVQLPPTTRRGLGSLERFCELAARTQGQRLVDLFHLWTGELAGCEYLLTMDDSLAEFLDQRVRPGLGIALACNPIGPDALLARLGVPDRDPLPLQTTTVVSLFSPRQPRGCGDAR